MRNSLFCVNVAQWCSVENNSVSDNTTDTVETLSGKRNDTTAPQNAVPSDNGTKKSEETKDLCSLTDKEKRLKARIYRF